MAMGKKRKKTTRARSPEKKEQMFQIIVKEGRKLFVNKGVNGFTIRELAINVGMSSGNLYNYVESKRELWIAIRRYDIQNIKDLLSGTVLNHTGSYTALLEKLYLQYLVYLSDNLQSFMMLFFVGLPPSKNKGPLELSYTLIRPMDVIKEVLGKAMDSKEIRQNPVEELSLLVFTILHGVAVSEIDFRFRSKLYDPTYNGELNLSRDRFHKQIVQILKMVHRIEIKTPENNEKM
ncbi:MAG: TetR/AcrR family transcriptional regulator [Promethearchaeota archaeon]